MSLTVKSPILASDVVEYTYDSYTISKKAEGFGTINETQTNEHPLPPWHDITLTTTGETSFSGYVKLYSRLVGEDDESWVEEGSIDLENSGDTFTYANITTDFYEVKVYFRLHLTGIYGSTSASCSVERDMTPQIAKQDARIRVMNTSMTDWLDEGTGAVTLANYKLGLIGYVEEE